MPKMEVVSTYKYFLKKRKNTLPHSDFSLLPQIQAEHYSI